MDKRTALAFALIFLIYIGWMQLYQHMGGNRTAAPAESTAVAPAPAETASAGGITPPASPSAPPSVETTPTPSPEAPAAEPMLTFVPPETVQPPLEVRGSLYDLTIDPRSGAITSWRGRQFLGHETGQPLQLVPEPEPEADVIGFSHATLPLADAPFRIEGPDTLRIPADHPVEAVLTARTAGGLVIRKIYTFRPDDYGIGLRLELDTEPGVSPEAVAAALGEPTWWRYVWDEGIASTESERWERGTFRAFARVGDEMTTRHQQNLDKDDKGHATLSGSLRFAGVQNRYFTIAGVVTDSTAVEGKAFLGGDKQTGQQSWALQLPLRPEPPRAPLGEQQLGLYLGPSQYDLLRAQGQGLEQSMDLGWKLFRPLSELILGFMTTLYKVIPNYGVVIILLSIVVNLLFYPLTRAQRNSMRRMQEIQPKIKAMQEKYKDDREKQSQKLMELYRKEKVNPAAGCLPLLIQMPVLFAFYQVLSKTVALRQAPFVLWINDLARPDALFRLPFSLPILGNEFNLLPLIMAAATYLQTSLTPTPSGGGQMAGMTKVMPFVMLFFFYNFPSGLVLYWLTNTLVTTYQAWRIQKTAPATGGATT